MEVIKNTIILWSDNHNFPSLPLMKISAYHKQKGDFAKLYTQGLDARFMTDDIAKLVCQTKIDMMHLAFDFMKNEKQIIKGLETFRKHFKKSDRSCRVYILTNYDTTHEEDYYRVKKVIELGYQPYVMIYQKGTHDRFLTDLARWANSSFIYRSCSFENYTPRVDKKTCKELYKAVI